MPQQAADTNNPVEVRTAPSQPPQAQAYGADQIKILEGLEAVRKRPGMYIGDTGIAGLHHLVYEAVDNSIDECMAGRATLVTVRIHPDGSVSVIDDGSGIPVDIKNHENPLYDGKPAVEIVMTVLHAGGKFGEENSAYKVSGGLHGVGISVVNALSQWLHVEVDRAGKRHKITFERGKTASPLHVLGPAPQGRNNAPATGTRVTFKPDHDIFPDTEFSFTTLSTRLRELAYLNPGVTIRIVDERVGPDGNIKDETYRFENGLREYVAHLNHNKQPLHEIIVLRGDNPASNLSCEVAFQYNDSYNELLLSFANNIRTVDGGTHLSGFKTAITRVLNAYARQSGILKEKDPVPQGEDLREGLAAVVSVKLPEPQFEGQTKGKLRNTEIEGFVSAIVADRLQTWLEEHPADAKRICLKGVVAAQAREAARKARELTRRKSALESGSMPAKLRDCTTRDIERSEMFIVEGDSAGGSATQGRDVETQAILPLRGKLLNVERARLDKILAFEEIRTLISALKCGIGEDFDVSKLRYGRVIIMTDADVDGSHIRTLLLTFFFRQMPELIRRNKVFIAQPPLYLITRGKKSQYVLNESRMNDVLIELGLEGASLQIRDITAARARGTAEPRVLRTIHGDELRRAVKALRRLAELAEIVERRGVRFLDLLAARSQDPEQRSALPTHRVTWQGGETYAWSDEHARRILEQQGLRLADLSAGAAAPAAEAPADPRPVAPIRELHENKELALVFTQLASLGIDIEDYGLTVEEAVTGERLPTKYAWLTPQRASTRKQRDAEGQQPAADSDPDSDAESADAPSAPAPNSAPASSTSLSAVPAVNIPAILDVLLDVGRRGMEVKRFKGLGEMDPEQLWETTMDVSRRTLLRVNWDDASAADELFTVLMGENVDQRRAYIEEHALEVKSLDV
ncbi:MAG: DNA topoisomerase (ATP-hydrolyzing) subunit B [Planctomycetota bacterium]|nr:DNA topoisomerase (ATP-hydrolyzing) subunit B [Planctomycetota bacterium]